VFLARRISDKDDELPQRLMNQRYKLKRSIIVASNRVVQHLEKTPRRQHHGDRHRRPADGSGLQP
jgi:hypothetical protein